MPEGSTVEILEKPISSADPLPQLTETPSLSLTERMEPKEAEALVGRIADFYQVPEFARRKGLASEIFVMPDEEFNGEVSDEIKKQLVKRGLQVELDSRPPSKNREVSSLVFEAFGTSEEQEAKRIKDINARNAQLIQEHVDNEGGITISVDETQSKILIRKDSGLDKKMVEVHEMIHAMANMGPEKGTGFHSNDGTGRNMNEAATQVLTLSLLHPDLSTEELFLKVKNGEIPTPYKGYVEKLLVTLFATGKDVNPITIKDLSQYYFAQEADVQAVKLQMDILQKAPENARPIIQEMFKSDFARKG